MHRILLVLTFVATALVVTTPVQAQLESAHVWAIVTEVKAGQVTMVPHYYGDRDLVTPYYDYIWVDTLMVRYTWEDERTDRPWRAAHGTYRTTGHSTESRPTVGDTVSCQVTYPRGRLVKINDYMFWPVRRPK